MQWSSVELYFWEEDAWPNGFFREGYPYCSAIVRRDTLWTYAVRLEPWVMTVFSFGCFSHSQARQKESLGFTPVTQQMHPFAVHLQLLSYVMSNRALKETAENCIIKTFGGKVCASEVWPEKIGLFHARFCERVRLHIEILFLNFLMGNRGKAAFWKIVPFYPPLSKSISSRVQCLVHKSNTILLQP